MRRGFDPAAVEEINPNVASPWAYAVFGGANRGVFVKLKTSARTCNLVPSFGTNSL
jgi:hypothetical protein